MPLRQNVDSEINATLSTNTEGQSVPLFTNLSFVAVMLAMVAAAMLFVLLVRIGSSALAVCGESPIRSKAMMATHWRQISFQTVAKIAPKTKRYALATLQLQFSQFVCTSSKVVRTRRGWQFAYRVKIIRILRRRAADTI
jgi:hypothetical protein